MWECMDGQTTRWVDGWMYRRMSERMDGWGRTNGEIDGWMVVSIVGCMVRWIDD